MLGSGRASSSILRVGDWFMMLLGVFEPPVLGFLGYESSSERRCMLTDAVFVLL
jgi:hypothetical protein